MSDTLIAVITTCSLRRAGCWGPAGVCPGGSHIPATPSAAKQKDDQLHHT